MINISDCVSDCNNENNLWLDLQMLIVNYNIPHSTANELLRILKNHGLLELPNDVRTLLGTPRNVCMHIKSVANGRYIHFEFFLLLLNDPYRCTSTFIKKNEITLNMNIDSLPLCKSFTSQF